MRTVPPPLESLAAFAEPFGIIVVPSQLNTPIVASDGRLTYLWVPASASPDEQGRILAKYMKDHLSSWSAA